MWANKPWRETGGLAIPGPEKTLVGGPTPSVALGRSALLGLDVNQEGANLAVHTGRS